MAQHATIETYVYKTVGDVSLTVDVHLPDITKYGVVAALSRQIMLQAAGKASSNATPDHSLPVLVFWHGGGLVGGNREGWLPRWLFKDALDAGFAVISPDYTLLTPRTAHDTLEDVKDLFSWIQDKLNPLLAGAGSQHLINTSKVAVSGASAGGYLAYLSATQVLPRPKALASIYAMGGDYLTEHYFKPKTAPFSNNQPLIEDSSIFNSITNAPPSTRIVRTGVDHEKEPRLRYFSWLLQEGTFLDVLTGEPGLSKQLLTLPAEERQAAIPTISADLFPQLAPSTSDFPPMISVHGTGDEAVLVEESRAFAEQVRKVGVDVELIELEGANHAFDLGYKSSKEHAGLEKVVPFLLKHLQ
ncbi:Alpha/Beta hydrolase protein [Leucosporidium creatinivorum]|uniref:Alpha/Beta hydrolase protein n=1 Tax=Leucosporidium creatinivorum TaxID=106004 RepID=A0A1Y2D406_9BASI|nr:Alpha/Beta hydrolase protein [Leucosporidium creatinivorum]